jgi:hypothetical protein
MAAEALIALGRSDLVIPWVENYKPHLDAHPALRLGITGSTSGNLAGGLARGAR